MKREQHGWEQRVAADPGHSHWYVERFRAMVREGKDIVGEARMVDAMLERGSRVLDAGCGPGRLGGYLHEVGHTVVGVDLDPVLIEAAEADHPGPTWLVGDLAELELPPEVAGEGFDVVVCAGNVLTFVAPSLRAAAVERMAGHLGEDGRLVVGFGAGRDYSFDRFRADSAAAGLAEDLMLSSWDLRPFTEDSGFLVAVLRRS